MNRYITSFTILLLSCSLSAQNFNESVEVTNELQVDLSGSERKTLPMEIPDSISRFKLNFDYEVFSRPYKGAYEFTPYNVLFRPLSQSEKKAFFYLRAGAGFAFKPELVAVLTPRLGENFQLSVYQDFSAFAGDYKGMDKFIYSGHEVKELLGVQGLASFKNCDLDFDLNYRGIWAKDHNYSDSPFHSFGASIGLRQLHRENINIKYDLNLDFHSSVEKNPLSDLRENALDFSGFISPVLDFPLQAEVGFNTGFDAYSVSSNWWTYYLKLDPRIKYHFKNLDLQAGFIFSLYTGGMRYQPIDFYPDVKASWRLFKKSLTLYAGIGGGDDLNSFRSFKIGNAHFNRLYIQDNWSRMLNTSAVKTDYYLGAKGALGTSFQYDLKGGYAVHKAGVLYGLDPLLESQAVLRYADYNLAYMGAALSYRKAAYEINADLAYRKMSYELSGADFFELPAFTGNLDFTYNWIERIYIGMNLGIQSSRHSQLYDSLPAYVDLGIHASAQLNSYLSLWAKGENLLASRVEEIPFTAQRWPKISLGLCLIFR